MARGHWVLPLASERSPVELCRERAHALAAVAATQLHLNPPVSTKVRDAVKGVPSLAPDVGVGSDVSPTYGALMRAIVTKVLAERPAPGAAASDELEEFEQLWGVLRELFFYWDAAIQDDLIATSDHLANGYELGRAVAETYWSLDPKAHEKVHESGTSLPNPASWQFLLGDERRRVMSRLLLRLAPYFGTFVAPAVASSVEVWGSVVAPQVPKWHLWGTKRSNRKMRVNKWWRAPHAQTSLRLQVANWYSLLVAGLDPETLLKPYAVLRSWRSAGKILQVLLAEAIVAVIGAGLIVAFGILMANASTNSTLEAVLAALGAVGITGASVQARIKAKTQSALTRLGQDLSTDLVAAQITITPRRPDGTRKLWESNEIREKIASRTVTAALPNTD